MSNDKSIRYMTAKHEGKTKTLSMNAWSRLLNVTEFFIRNKKLRTKMTDQQIIDAAVASNKSCNSIEAMRKRFLFRGARA